MSKLFKKTAIFSLSVITAIGMMGAVAAPSTANAQSLSSSQIDSIISLLQSFGADQGTIDDVEASLKGEAPSGDTGSSSGQDMTTKCDFDRDLSTGSQGSDVKCLQEYLNDSGYTVSASGVGSPGNETDYFGPRTKQAVAAWQNANATDVLEPVGLSSGTGYWGQSSIDHYNQLAAQAAADESDDSDSGDTTATPDSGVNVSGTDLHDSDVTVPQNATLIRVGEFTFSSGENTDLESMTFQRKGAGNRTDWDKLYIYDGDTRVGSGRTINTNQEVSFSSLNVDLDDGDSKTLTLRGTVSTSQSGNQHYFSLSDVDFDDSTEISGLPVDTRKITISNTRVGSLDVDRNDPVDTSVNLGDQDVEIFNADLTASTEDMDVKSIILEQYNSVSVDDLDSWTLEMDSVEQDADISVDGDEITITFDGDGYFLEDGDSVELSLSADMTSGAYIKGSSGIIELNTDDSSSVDAVGRDFGYGVQVTHADEFGNPNDSVQITINASELNFSFKGPQTNDIGLNSEDVVLFETEVISQSEMEFDVLSFKFNPASNSNPYHLQNLRLVNKTTGKTLAGPDEIASTTSQTVHQFNDVFTLPEGTNTLQVVSDIGNDTQNGAETTVSLLVDAANNGGSSSDNLDAENLTTDENVDITSNVIPAGQLTGKKQTFTQANLDVSNSPSPTSQTYVVGKSNTVLGAYVLDASGVSNIDVRQIQVDLSEDSSTSTISELSGSVELKRDSADGTTIDSQSVGTGSGAQTVTFDTSGELNLDSNEQVKVYVVGDLKSDFDAGSGDVSATSSLSSITAKDSDNKDPLFNDSSSYTAVNGTSFTIGNSGSFNTVAFGGNNPSEDMVITPGGDVLFSSYRLRPQNEDLQMRDFVVSIGTTTEKTYFSSVKAFFNGVQKGGSKTITSDTAKYNDVNVDLTKDQDTTVDFKAALQDDFSNLDSGAELQLYFATSTSNYDIVGLDSGASVTFPTSSISSSNDGLRTYQIANSYPSFSYTGSDATLSAGTKNLYKFDVTAENDDVELRELTFEIQVSEGSSSTNGDLQVGSFDLLKDGQVVGSASTTDSDLNGTIGDNGADGASETASTTIKINSVSHYTVGSGNTATFTLRGNVSGVGSDDANSISTSLDTNDENLSFSKGDTTSSVTGNTVWSDTYKTFNGTYLDFPTDSQTLSL